MKKLTNYVFALSLLAIQILNPSHAAELYLKLGIGWIKDMPVKGTVTIQHNIVFEERIEINIDQPYATGAIGVMSDNGWYAEVNRFGVLTRSSESLTRYELGKRWAIKF